MIRLPWWSFGILALGTVLVLLAGDVLSVGQQLVVLAFLFALAWAVRERDVVPTTTADVLSEERLPIGFGRALLQKMPAALIVISKNERVTYANPAALDLFPNVVAGVHFSSLIRAPAFVEAIEEIFEGRDDLKFTFVQAGARERMFEARASFLPAGAGQDFGKTDQVIVQVEDRTRDMAMLRTRSDFVANASHELRTPLASILGYIETLQGHAKEDPAARELFLDIMMKQAMRMKRLVDDLMSLSRIELNAHVRPDTQLSIYPLVAEAVSSLYPVANQSDVLLQVDLPDADGLLVLGDRDQLAQVVVNLADNAIKYGGAGKKVTVKVADPDPRYPRQVGISFVDHGPGIARENIPRLTERFFRVSPAQSKDKGGTGLGLAITKHILARHSGALDIRSTLGEGSVFTMWIPALTDQDDSAGPA